MFARARTVAVAVASLLAATAMAIQLSPTPAGAVASPSVAVYDSVPAPLPFNLPSEGAEAVNFSELGNKVSLAPTTEPLQNVVETFSTQGCESGGGVTCLTTPGATFSEPITFNIYSAGPSGAVGNLLVTTTQTFNIPYRPSASINCSGGGWQDPSGGCHGGLAVNLTFDFSSRHLVLPSTVIYGVSYNTTHHGPVPYGTGTACFTSSGGCGYDSLNVGFGQDPTNVTVGSQTNPGTLYLDSDNPSNYCDLGAAGTGVFRLDSPNVPPCYGVSTPAAPPYYVPAVQFNVLNPPPASSTGYWEVASDGGIFAFGPNFLGSMGGKPLNAPVVGMAQTPSGLGYWEAASDGGIFTFGDAGFFGSMGGRHLNAAVTGMASTPTGDGYWEVASDGGIFTFGDAGFFGSMGGTPHAHPIIGIAPTPSGKGYWEAASDGTVYPFGDAQSLGSTGTPLNAPIVGIAATTSAQGYWLAASDGGIFTFGNAGFFGSMGGRHLNEPVVGLARTPTGAGYTEVASDGGVFNFGDSVFAGSMGGQHLNEPMVGIAAP